MKNSDSHIYLYAKGHYEENDIWEDLGKIVAHRCAFPRTASKRDVFQVVTGVTIDAILKQPNPKNRFQEFITNASPFKYAPFDIKGNDYDYATSIIEACLTELMKVRTQDDEGNVILELDESDPGILPLSEGAKKWREDKVKCCKTRKQLN